MNEYQKTLTDNHVLRFFYIFISTKDHYCAENDLGNVTYDIEVEFYTLHVVSLVFQYSQNVIKKTKQEKTSNLKIIKETVQKIVYSLHFFHLTKHLAMVFI